MNYGRKYHEINKVFGEMKSERGATAAIVAILSVALLGFAALAIDIGHLYVVRGELQNASDAGALGGARVLYNDEGTAVNPDANQDGYDTAIANKSENLSVDVHWTGGNEGDVQRGHWSFTTKTFTPNDTTVAVPLWDVTTLQLDQNTDFINAVRVITRREDTPASAFFASIFGRDSFTVGAEAIAYIGFAGTLGPEESDMPIAICKDSLLINDKYSCSIGRMINSGQNVQTHETGGWTSFYQGDDACQGGTNSNELKNIIDPPGPVNCFGKNEAPIYLGENIATLGGEAEAAFKKLRTCWDEQTGKIVPWNLTLPVITCPSNNVSTCEEVVGAVSVEVVWITGEGSDPQYKNAPTKMADWSYPADPGNTNGQARWSSFISHFNLQNADGTNAPYQMKAIYFKPNCEPHIPRGRSGGENFGIIAKIPVLVK